MRSFDKCLATHHWHFIRHFPGADFFVSTVKDADSHKAELLRVKYPNARVEIEVVDEQPDCVAEMREKGVDLPKEWSKGKPYTHEPYPISVHPQGVLRQLWQLERVWQLMHATIEADYYTSKESDRAKYDVIIRCRPDLWFHSANITRTEVIRRNDGEDSSARCWLVQKPGDAFLPYWGQFGGVNDRFALLGGKAAAPYFHTYNHTPQLAADGCPIHPESLVAASLEREWITPQTLFAEFSTLRTTGEMRPPEIATVDLARLHA